MPDDDPERRLTLRQANQARDDFAAILDELEFVNAQLARLPTRKELWRAALMGMLGGSALTIAVALAFFSAEAFWR
jgi:hypothetical protein